MLFRSAVRIGRFEVTTNASGALTSANILVEKWLTGATPHTTADYFSWFFINGSSVAQLYNNARCNGVGTTPYGVTDFCLVASLGTQSSAAQGATVSYSGGGAPVAATPVPTLNEYALMLLASLMAGFAGWKLRKRRAA